MGQFLDYEVETPQEVIARIEERNQARSQGARTPQQQRLANISNSMDSLFGAFKVKAAEDKQKRLMSAVKSSTRGMESASPQEKARARAEAILSVAEGENDLALMQQAESKLMELDQAAYERSRLVAGDGRAEETHEQNMQLRQMQIEQIERKREREDRFGQYQGVISGDFENPQVRSFNLATEDGRADYEDFMEANPGASPVPPQVIGAMYRNTVGRTPARDRVSKNEAATLRKTTEGHLGAMEMGRTYLEIIRQDPGIFTQAGELSALTGRAVRQFQAFGEALDRTFSPEVRAENARTLNANADLANITNTRQRGMAVALAYALAKAKDPAGRLSDKDIEFAMLMIGGKDGNVDPRAVTATLEDQLFNPARRHLARLQRTPDDQFDGDIMAMLEETDRVDILLKSLMEGREDPIKTTQQRIDEASDEVESRWQGVERGNVKFGGLN